MSLQGCIDHSPPHHSLCCFGHCLSWTYTSFLSEVTRSIKWDLFTKLVLHSNVCYSTVSVSSEWLGLVWISCAWNSILLPKCNLFTWYATCKLPAWVDNFYRRVIVVLFCIMSYNSLCLITKLSVELVWCIKLWAIYRLPWNFLSPTSEGKNEVKKFYLVKNY